MGWKFSEHGRDEKRMQNFGWMSERKRPLGRPTRRWAHNIRMNLREIGWEVFDCTYLA
jgi:hypothetical protein